jgi:hypothetical protein
MSLLLRCAMKRSDNPTGLPLLLTDDSDRGVMTVRVMTKTYTSVTTEQEYFFNKIPPKGSRNWLKITD